MNNSEYVLKAQKTDLESYKEASERLDEKLSVMLHFAIGLSTESAEILDQIKKHVYYNKPLDIINLEEELGDCLWYIALACRTLNVSFESLMEKNINKLMVRYGEKFSEEKAIKRNLEQEREALE